MAGTGGQHHWNIQHRLKGLSEASEEVQQNYEVLLAFIIGYDRSVIAQQFYTINYEQKPVNKSLLYHLMGEFSSELDESTYLHKAVKVLNEYEKSPFHKRIKMLGSTPRNLSKDERKLYSISLAFLIDALSNTISHKLTKSIYQPIFRYYYEREELQIEIIRFLIKFFNSVRELAPHWDDPEKSIVSKGMGVGALLRVLNFIFVTEFISSWKSDPFKIQRLSKDEVKTYLIGLEKVNFGKDGPFGGTGSSGSVNKIKEAIVEELNYFSKYDSYNEMVTSFKSDGGLKDQFMNWLIKHTKVA